MAYSDYQAPGIDVTIERRRVEEAASDTEFYPVFIGTGVTSRTRNIEKLGLKADATNFPEVKLEFDLLGEINLDLFNKTKFDIAQLVVTDADGDLGSEQITLSEGTGYTVVQGVKISSTDTMASLIVDVSNTTVTAADIIYDLSLSVSNTEKDFDLKKLGTQDRFYSKNLLGPTIINEDGTEMFNDIAIAAEVAFRMELDTFYYLEVPRNYGERPAAEDFHNAIEKNYFADDAYRLVPLSNDNAILKDSANFVDSVSNPVDRRETVSFISYDTASLTDIDDMSELVSEIGGLSESINSKRVCNVFGGVSVEMTMEGQVYVLPPYYLAAAVACLDTVVGEVDPLSLREIDVFRKINGPRFRPQQWDQLAKLGVFIIKQDNENEAPVIRHQLTTAQSNDATDQEYSIVKNWDVVTKRFRDRFKPYAGQHNIDSGYTEKLEGTLATTKQEILENGLARSMSVVTAWQKTDGKDGRNLITRIRMEPVFPANHLDVFLIV